MSRTIERFLRLRYNGSLMLNESNKKRSSHTNWFSRPILFLWVISVCIVCYLSLAPEVEFPLSFKWDDLACHSLAYFWLSVLPFLGFQDPRSAIASALLMIPLGVGLEVAQHFVPDRFFSTADMMANSFGALLGILFGKYLRSAFPVKYGG